MAFRKRKFESRKTIYISGTGSIIALLLFLVSMQYYGVNIETTGDLLCLGDENYPCISYINISTSTYNLAFLSSETIYFDKNITYFLYRWEEGKRNYCTKYRAYYEWKETNETDLYYCEKENEYKYCDKLSASKKMCYEKTGYQPFDFKGNRLKIGGLWHFKLVGYKDSNQTLSWGIKAGLRDDKNLWYGLNNQGETIEIKRKTADYNGIKISAKSKERCSYKPDESNDGYKICNSTIQIDNNLTAPISADDLILDINMPIKNNEIKYYYPEIINPKEKTNISVVYEVPQYDEGHYNISIKLKSGYILDLDPEVGACGSLDTANSTYTLTTSVSDADTCMTVAEANITLDCQGYTITFQTSTITAGNALQSSYKNTTVRNCIIVSDKYKSGHAALSLTGGGNVNVSKNNITAYGSSEGGAIHIDGSPENCVIDRNNITGKTGTQSTRLVEIRSGVDINITNNNMSKTGSANSHYVIDNTGALTNQLIKNNRLEIGNCTDSICIIVRTQSTGEFIDNIFKLDAGDELISEGIRLQTGIINVTNNSINMIGNSTEGLRVLSGASVIINNTIVLTDNCVGGDHFGAGIALTGGVSNMTNNNISNTNASSYFIRAGTHNVFDSNISYDLRCQKDVYGYSGGILNLINTTFNHSALEFEATAASTVNIKWYFDALVNDTTEALIGGARVTAVNRTNNQVFSEVTESNGEISRQIILSYMQNRTESFSYNNHTINASKAGYTSATIILNITKTNSTFQNFTLKRLFFVTNLTPINRTYNTNTIDFNISLSLAGTGCFVNINSTGNTTMEKHNNTYFNYTLTDMEEGEYNVSFICNDTTVGVGNLWNETDPVYFNIEFLTPTLSIHSPANQSYDVNNLDFNVSSNISLSWCGIALDDDENFTMEQHNSSYFNYTNSSIEDGTHLLNFTCNSTFNIYNSTHIEFFTDISDPVTALVSPVNDSSESQDVTFVCNASDAELSNLSIYVWDPSDVEVYRNETNYTGTYLSSSYFARLPPDDSTYKWACRACDILHHCNQTSNYTINLDYVDFNITLFNVSHIDIYPNSTTVNDTWPVNQTSDKGIFTYTNNLSYKINITARLNETKFPFLYMHLGDSSSYGTSIILNTSWQIIVLDVNIGGVGYIWLFQDYYKWFLENGTWTPELDIAGRVTN